MPCIFIEIQEHFEGKYYLCNQGQRVNQAMSRQQEPGTGYELSLLSLVFLILSR
jgi:hypothetical protein